MINKKKYTLNHVVNRYKKIYIIQGLKILTEISILVPTINIIL